MTSRMLTHEERALALLRILLKVKDLPGDPVVDATWDLIRDLVAGADNPAAARPDALTSLGNWAGQPVSAVS